jgi:ribosomal protein S18 acetylase RimI-like enzyme
VDGWAIRITDRADDRDVAELREAVESYNVERTGYDDGRSLSCFLRDPDGRLQAGLDGFTWGGYAKVEFLWVDEALRGRGLGRRLMEAAIEEARTRGCDVIVVDTHTFQAPGLYRRLGFVEVGRTDGTPLGWGQVYFSMPLTGPLA